MSRKVVGVAWFSTGLTAGDINTTIGRPHPVKRVGGLSINNLAATAEASAEVPEGEGRAIKGCSRAGPVVDSFVLRD